MAIFLNPPSNGVRQIEREERERANARLRLKEQIWQASPGTRANKWAELPIEPLPYYLTPKQ